LSGIAQFTSPVLKILAAGIFSSTAPVSGLDFATN